MRTLLIVKLGSTYPWLSEEAGDFEDWVIQRLYPFAGRFAVVSPTLGQPLPAVDRAAGIILTGSHAMVTAREPWSEHTAAWIRKALCRRTPLLGICYGHQLLAHAAGGVVGYNVRGDEFGTTLVQLHEATREDPLFCRLPSPLPVQVCHAQSVLILPEGATLLASNAHDPHHAFRLGSRAWGVQFHPEFSPAATRGYIEHHKEELRSNGRDPERLLRSVRHTPEAASLLGAFGKLVGDMDPPERW